MNALATLEENELPEEWILFNNKLYTALDKRLSNKDNRVDKDDRRSLYRNVK